MTEYVRGLDISHWQGRIDWQRVKDAGYVFAYIKASEALGTDSMFRTNSLGARNAGVLWGAYHFLRPGNTQAQVNHFLSLAQGADLPPALDVETTDNFVGQAEAWLQEVEARSTAPIIYTRRSFWDSWLNPNMPQSRNLSSRYRLWVANYEREVPLLPRNWNAWLFWQYTDKGRVLGINSNVDLNYFSGPAEQLFNINYKPVPPVVEPVPTSTLGFDAPIGTFDERRSLQLWPGDWIDAWHPRSGYAQKYTDSAGHTSYHTGADLNKNKPVWDSDRGSPVYAASDGIVRFAGRIGNYWRNVITIEHHLGNSIVITRYAHVDNMLVSAEQSVTRGQQIATVGHSGPNGPYHLHFDVSLTTALLFNPGHWPGSNLAGVREHYVDPIEWIRAHRPTV